MSESNAELARRGFEAATRGDLKAIGAILHPNIKWHGADGLGENACHNRDEALHFIREAVRRGDVGDLVDAIDAGDQVVVVMRPPGDPEPGESELRATLATFRDGKVVEMVAYETPEAALAAARS